MSISGEEIKSERKRSWLYSQSYLAGLLLFLLKYCTPGDSDEPTKLTEEKRELGLVVCRGPSIVMLCPEGMEPISNPFVTAGE